MGLPWEYIALAVIVVLVVGLFLARTFGVSALYFHANPLSRDEVAKRIDALPFNHLERDFELLSVSDRRMPKQLESELRDFLTVLANNVGTYVIVPFKLKRIWDLLVKNHRIYHIASDSLLGKGGSFEHHRIRDLGAFDLDKAEGIYRDAYRNAFGRLPDAGKGIGRDDILATGGERIDTTFQELWGQR